jgi:hypothetical protein
VELSPDLCKLDLVVRGIVSRHKELQYYVARRFLSPVIYAADRHAARAGKDHRVRAILRQPLAVDQAHPGAGIQANPFVVGMHLEVVERSKPVTSTEGLWRRRLNYFRVELSGSVVMVGKYFDRHVMVGRPKVGKQLVAPPEAGRAPLALVHCLCFFDVMYRQLVGMPRGALRSGHRHGGVFEASRFPHRSSVRKVGISIVGGCRRRSFERPDRFNFRQPAVNDLVRAVVFPSVTHMIKVIHRITISEKGIDEVEVILVVFVVTAAIHLVDWRFLVVWLHEIDPWCSGRTISAHRVVMVTITKPTIALGVNPEIVSPRGEYARIPSWSWSLFVPVSGFTHGIGTRAGSRIRLFRAGDVELLHCCW